MALSAIARRLVSDLVIKTEQMFPAQAAAGLVWVGDFTNEQQESLRAKNPNWDVVFPDVISPASNHKVSHKAGFRALEAIEQAYAKCG